MVSNGEGTWGGEEEGEPVCLALTDQCTGEGRESLLAGSDQCVQGKGGRACVAGSDQCTVFPTS